MMGKEKETQEKLFYTGHSLERRIRADHPLRRIRATVDFGFVAKAVADKYGKSGNVSIPPSVILKLMLLLVIYNVRSERELMTTLPERLDWLWFLGFDLDSDIPNHSVLSKARKRWGVEAFEGFFERIVLQCVEAGLVDGRKIFLDSSLIEADASSNSIVDTRDLKQQVRGNYRELEKRLTEREANNDPEDKREINRRYISSTDPEAAIVRRGMKPKLTHQIHRAVDGENEIITATRVTAGDVNEAHLLGELIDRHGQNSGKEAETVVADTKYGTKENFLECHDRGINAHIPELGASAKARNKDRGIYSEEKFLYTPERDAYICPAGKLLHPRSHHKARGKTDYAAKKHDCQSCQLHENCTKNPAGRTIARHEREEELNAMLAKSRTQNARRDIRERQHLMERSFARAKRYGYKRARWRGQWRVAIQEYLTCAVQNIMVLINRGGGKRKTTKAAEISVKTSEGRTFASIIAPLAGTCAIEMILPLQSGTDSADFAALATFPVSG